MRFFLPICRRLLQLPHSLRLPLRPLTAEGCPNGSKIRFRRTNSDLSTTIPLFSTPKSSRQLRHREHAVRTSGVGVRLSRTPDITTASSRSCLRPPPWSKDTCGFFSSPDIVLARSPSSSTPSSTDTTDMGYPFPFVSVTSSCGSRHSSVSAGSHDAISWLSLPLTSRLSLLLRAPANLSAAFATLQLSL